MRDVLHVLLPFLPVQEAGERAPGELQLGAPSAYAVGLSAQLAQVQTAQVRPAPEAEAQAAPQIGPSAELIVGSWHPLYLFNIIRERWPSLRLDSETVPRYSI